MTVMYWLLAAAAFLVLEMLTMGLTSIWFAGGALVGAVVARMGLSLGIQVAAFVVVSIVLLMLTRPLAGKYLNSRTVKTNADSLVGEACVVTQTIDNLKAQGQVLIRGQVWTARSTKEDLVIPEDSRVKVIEISGVKLMVEPVSE
ncbi:MAG: NfeD family protein [Lachnospiraceae bacterium]|nr:NfeD family protein [Lachnospiraceae bacterium]